MAKKKLIQRIQKDVPLKDYTTFKIGGPAKYFLEAKNKEEIIEAVKWAKENKVPFFVLGGGSNLLVSDHGFNGLVIKAKNQTVSFCDGRPKMIQNKTVAKLNDRSILQQKGFTTIEAGAGVKLQDLVELSLKKGLTGLEWAAGIPQATVGGAVKVNASAFGSSMKDIVKNVEVFDGVILFALLELKKGNRKEVEGKIGYVLNYREKNHPMEFPSAGCIFKNPLPTQVSSKFGRARKVPAAQLIEQCGLKGRKIGGAAISEKHANFIVNLGAATAKDVLALVSLAKKEVKKKFDIELKEEIQFLGSK